jgi:hypothetical protein
MSRRAHSMLVLAVAFMSACTAWQYEITPCDPNARDLSRDICNTLNAGNTGCMLYQCDGQTSSCREMLRDFDRDGDPDYACGGTDCNDFDRTVFGREGDSCTCRQSVIGTTCSVGQPDSPCQNFANYTCSANVLSCPATVGAPRDWSDSPSPRGSYDWDCDGTTTMACSWVDPTGKYFRTECPSVACTQGQIDQINSRVIGTMCEDYCKTFNNNNDGCNPIGNRPYIFNCNTVPKCGDLIGVCFCRWDGALGVGPCKAEPYSTIGSIYCK